MHSVTELCSSLVDSDKVLRLAKLSCSRKTKVDQNLIDAYIRSEWRDIILNAVGGYNHPVLVNGIET